MEQKFYGKKEQIEQATKKEKSGKCKHIMAAILAGTILFSGGVSYAKDIPAEEMEEQCETDELAQENPLGHLHPDYEKMQREEAELLKKTKDGFRESLKVDPELRKLMEKLQEEQKQKVVKEDKEELER